MFGLLRHRQEATESLGNHILLTVQQRAAVAPKLTELVD